VQVNLNFESRKDPYERSAQLPEDSERKPFYSVGASTKTQDQAAPLTVIRFFKHGCSLSRSAMTRFNPVRKLRNSRFPHHRCDSKYRAVGGGDETLIYVGYAR